MKIVFHHDFLKQYDYTPAGDSGRLEPALRLLKKISDYQFVTPESAPLEAIERAHTLLHIKDIQNSHEGVHDFYQLALLGAGGAILCADIAASGEPAFGLIRPPGHHASRNSCWGFCYFNNIAVSLLHLRAAGKCKRAFILDFDLHIGDGNYDILDPIGDYEIYNPSAPTEQEYLHLVQKHLDNAQPCDIIVASAGFDQGINDWGRLLSPEAYCTLGQMMKKFAEERCEGRRYALLEGGYNFDAMATNIRSFCEGFQ